MRLLLDTHAFLWWIADSGRLSRKARRLIADDTNNIAVSAASAWKIATKHRIGRLPGGEAVALDVAGRISDQGFSELPISVNDGERAGRLPGPHRDPFDRMLVAQALARGLPIISIDGVFDRYGLDRLW
ncbi:type II toxin-antitoxin system VapC family toxin [Candidatus Palauibacter polyketidifaciens]|uniref:type II toxin-antitoxin system VapC family toxin n=1 Tax=Candidatus Palauibacter polyketidifaciens TaxID=3056740 RepID=UPI00238F780A|nr:type II toxin-antitoxin system VapC family toxin [Candidatus Palauibacter polyketidifaciens]MDE2721223.1 type II toxin-antitoxin system VapC family toxin [Candidatus Palauibacter polyketidifaciens]